MNTQTAQLLDFAQIARGLDDAARLKLILFAAGAKPATFFALKITPQNLDEKEHLERHLRACNLVFIVGKPRAYEEITSIRGNTIYWKMKGTWYGYDVFKNQQHVRLFQDYLQLVRNQKHAQADRIAGKLYDYPSCCVEHYIKEHDIAFVRKKYTHYSYYKHVHEIELAFPLLQHTACLTKCPASRKMSAHYAAVLRKNAPEFWKQFSRMKKHSTDVIVDTESEFLRDNSTKPVFPRKDGHEYALITLAPIQEHYYLLSFLTKKTLARGTVLPARITRRYNYANVTLGKPKRRITGLHHERRFTLP